MSELQGNDELEIDWDAIPRTGSGLLPGDYLGLVREEVDEVVWESTGTVVYVIALEVKEPAELAGMYHTDRCFVGTDTDKLAKDPSTWASPKNRNAQRVRDFFTFSKTPRGKMAFMRAEAKGHEIEFRLTEGKNGYMNAKYFERGTLSFGLASDKAAGKTVPAVPRANGAAGAPKVQRAAVGGSETVVAASPRTVKPQTVKCPECDEVVEKRDFVAHSATHDE